MNTPKYENFPEELKTKPNWVVWEKGTKLPINPKTLGNAKSNLPSTWTSLDVAKQALVKSPEKLGGVGFNPARNVLVLDFDDAGPGG
jgi:primase-polymerase (primpol)-like protein